MSIALAELPTVPTQVIISEIQQDLLPLARDAARLSPFAKDPNEILFFLDENGSARVTKMSKYVTVQVTNFDCTASRSDKLDIVARYKQDENGALTPVPITEAGIEVVVEGTQHHTPKYWPHDNGMSLEMSPTAPSLPHEKVLAVAVLAAQVAMQTENNQLIVYAGRS